MYWERRDREAAIARVTEAGQLAPSPTVAAVAASIRFSFGDVDEGERLLLDLEEMVKTLYLPPGLWATVELARGRTEEAISWTERSANEYDITFQYLRSWWELLGIMSDPLIRDAVERLGLP